MNGERGAGCTYEPRPRSRRANANALLFSRNTAPRPLSIRTLPSKPYTIGDLFSEETLPSSGTPLPAWSKSSESDLLLPEPLTRPSGATLLTLSDPSESTPSPHPPPPLAPRERSLAPSFRARGAGMLGPSLVARDAYDITKRVPRTNVSPFTVLPSIHFRTIPRPLQIPLSLIPPERVQISPIAGSDLDMTLCVLFRFLYFAGSWGLNNKMLDAWRHYFE